MENQKIPTPRTDAVDISDNWDTPDKLADLSRTLERELHREKEKSEALTECLLKLDEEGGLGERHNKILEALGTPNGKFCTRARQCLIAKRCIREISCID